MSCQRDIKLFLQAPVSGAPVIYPDAGNGYLCR
jgi:hypothetical protein